MRFVMIHGLEVFKEYFIDFTDSYVIIGGSACTVLLGALGVDFRATHDIDLVLLADKMDERFGKAFWRFIDNGKYSQYQKAPEPATFYRFFHPENSTFPKMIELFSRNPGMSLKVNSTRMRVSFSDEIKSLSAILLDDVYYEALTTGRQVIDNLSVLNLDTLILFKIKAWLDLSFRKSKGEFIPSHDIKKHKNDIFRLLPNCDASTVTSCHSIIKSDIRNFINAISFEMPNLKDLGLEVYQADELLNIIKMKFL